MNTKSLAQRVPAELWMQIFEYVDTPEDLHSVVLTCRRFHNYALRPLHRHVQWRSPAVLAQNLPLFHADPHLALEVCALELQISTLSHYFSADFVTLDSLPLHITTLDAGADAPRDLHFWPLTKSLDFYDLRGRYTFATKPLYDALIDRMHSFRNLSTLTFSNMLFSDQLFGVLHALLNLRTLHIELCLFPGRKNCSPRDHSTLPITELSLLNLRRRVLQIHCMHGSPVADMDNDMSHILELALARNLRTLRVDSTADVFNSVYCAWDANGMRVYKTPPHLTHLYVLRKRRYPTEVQPQFVGEPAFPDRALFSVVKHCPTLTTFSLQYPLPRHRPFPEAGSLPRLRRCEGFPDAVSVMTAGRPVEAVSLLKADGVTPSVLLENFGILAKAHPKLQMLSVELKTWDEEILHGICQLLPELRKLRIVYDYGGPSEDKVVSFGPHFLARLPNLHTVHIYAKPRQAPSSAPSSADPSPPPSPGLTPSPPQTPPAWPAILAGPPGPGPWPWPGPQVPGPAAHAHAQAELDTHIPHEPRFDSTRGWMFDGTYDSIEAEQLDLVIPWNRYCKKLREVRVHASYVLRRDFDGGSWRVWRVKDGGVTGEDIFEY